jgi:hypothetical protein
LFLGFTRRRSYVQRSRPSKILTLTTDRPLEEVRELVLSLTTTGKYHLEEDKPECGLITLSSTPTTFSWGFFLPVYVEPVDGKVRVSIGIETKFVQFGPIVTHHHKACEAAVRTALAIS